MDRFSEVQFLNPCGQSLAGWHWLKFNLDSLILLVW